MEHAQTGTGQETGKTEGIMGRVRNTANTRLSQQKDRATEGLGSVAQAVRQSTQQLRDQKHFTLAQYVEQAADQLDKLSTRLKEKNINELVDDAQRFARQRPALFIGSAFAVGLIGSRFFKSSAERYEAPRRSFDTGSPTSTAYVGGEFGGAGYRGADIPATGYGGTEIR
jgi:ElaB/YqjD/DUF883 family membrane-anchored ribosome-binding protein